MQGRNRTKSIDSWGLPVPEFFGASPGSTKLAGATGTTAIVSLDEEAHPSKTCWLNCVSMPKPQRPCQRVGPYWQNEIFHTRDPGCLMQSCTRCIVASAYILDWNKCVLHMLTRARRSHHFLVVVWRVQTLIGFMHCFSVDWHCLASIETAYC